MQINHLIIGAISTDESTRFYQQILGYQVGDSFVDTGTGTEGVILRHTDGPELLIVPFRPERLPNPQHVAFEVKSDRFDEIIQHCRTHGIPTRAQPPLNSIETGCSDCEQSGVSYEHFYFTDPSSLNIEIMRRK